MEADFPEGWDLDRVRARLPLARLLDPQAHYVVEVVGVSPPPAMGYDEITPTLIVQAGAGDLCIVRDADDGRFLLGQFDESDGSIVCFSRYVADLGEVMKTM